MSSGSTNLNRTPSSASNRRTWTWSAWVKRSNISTGNQVLFQAVSGGFPEKIQFTSSNRIEYDHDIAGTDYTIYSDFKFQDLLAWYHIVVAKDTTQATETDRIKVYVNGEQISMTEEALGYPGQNYEGQINNNVEHNLGSNTNGGEFFSGCMSHVNFVDGAALTPSSFGSTDATTGEWKIITNPSVTYGTNGFFMFKNDASLNDDSGNSNNFSLEAGTLLPTQDNPSNLFATLNPYYVTQGTETYATGNNTYKCNSNQYGTSVSTICPTSGKWYFEVKSTFDDGTKGFMGVIDVDNSFLTSSHKYLGMSGHNNCGIGYYGGGNIVANGNQNIHTGLHDWNDGDILGCALDIDNNKIYFHVNGTYLTLSGNVQNPSSGQYGIDTSSSLYGGAVGFGVSSKDNFNIYTNFGNGSFHDVQLTGTTYQDSNSQGVFKYQPPTNFLALCTKNLNE